MKHRFALIVLGLLVCAGCGDIGGGKRRQASGSAGGAGLVGSDINSLAAPAQPAQPAAQPAPAAMTGPAPNLPQAQPGTPAQPGAQVVAGQPAAPAEAPAAGGLPGLPGVSLPGQPQPNVITEKPQPGVSGKGNYGPGIVTTPISVYFQAQERLIFLQVDQAMNLFQAEHGNKPKTEEEFMKQIIEFNQIRLPQLPPGSKYKYDPAKGELLVERPQ